MQDCVIWRQSCQPSGYGQTFHNGKVSYAHRVAYERANGPIPDDLTVHHRCENRRCVNPEHMELLRRDEHAGGRGHGKLLLEQAGEIKRLLADGWSVPWIAEAYGVSRTLVIYIRQGKRWAAA